MQIKNEIIDINEILASKKTYLKLFLELCQKNKLEQPLLFFGTLLGYVREDAFIENDSDIDLVYTNDYIQNNKEKFINIMNELQHLSNLAFSVYENKSSSKFSSIINGILDDTLCEIGLNMNRDIAVGAWREIGSLLNIYIFRSYKDYYYLISRKKKKYVIWYWHKKYIEEVQKTYWSYINHDVIIPIHSHEILSMDYGADYLIPNSKWSARNFGINHKFIIENESNSYISFDDISRALEDHLKGVNSNKLKLGL